MLAQNVVANLRLSQIVARRMIELAAAEAPPSVADRAIVNVSSVHARRAPSEAPRLLGELRRARAADPGAGGGARAPTASG